MITEPLDRLEVAARAMGALVDRVTAEQRSLPTPCEEWNVDDLVSHVAAGNFLFATALAGGAAEHAPARSEPGGPAAAFSRSSRELLAAFARPGALEAMIEVPFGTVPGAVALELRVTELLGHGWDLARATGQRLEVPDEVVLAAIGFTEPNLARVPPDRSPFSPPKAVPAGAPPLDRLAGLLGREVGAGPAGD